ncbi:leucine-rich repeat protein SHOC-2 [Onthophagus taurus]|uniref:leucine-rich repeat protein SHOC-2 n=1 Tax=Onthophagus taurus TaxID=166361 RepID=UPI0039BE1014
MRMTTPQWLTSAFGGVLFALLLVAVAHPTAAYDCEGRRRTVICNCRRETYPALRIVVHCQKTASFAEIVDHLRNNFGREPVTLEIDSSQLDDLHNRTFRELNMTIVNLKLNNSGLRFSDLKPDTFSGLRDVLFFSLADNPIEHIPTTLLKQMPNIATLDLGRMRVQHLREHDLNDLGNVQGLLLPSNLIEEIDTRSIPANVTRLHLGHNKIRHLNGSLRHLNELVWLFINDNSLTSLDNQLPENGNKMILLHAANNKIKKLPQELRYLTKLSSLFMYNNEISTLDTILSRSSLLERLQLERNHLKMLQVDDFTGAIKLESLHLDYNHLTSLNGSLHPLINLGFLNVSHNRLQEFSFEEIKGLDRLTILDLSHNRIRHLVGFTVNSLEWGSNLSDLNLDHNDIHRLNCAVSGFTKLVRLNVSFNKITHISPDDFIGLENLHMLDISHNHLSTLEETSKTYLPKLQELLVSHNRLHRLDKDFHGLPVLCWADLSYNQIISIGRELVAKTHCRYNDIRYNRWANLSINLAENPILCDISYPDLKIDMERNHTILSGSTECLSYPNVNYLGSRESPQISLDHKKRIEPPYLDPFYNVAYNPVTEMSNQVKKSIQTENEEQNNHQNQISSQESDPTKYTLVQQQIFVPLPNQFANSNEQDQNNEMQQPDSYQHQTYHTPERNLNLNNRIETIHMNNKPLNVQQVYTHVDPVLQEQQLTQLASEIEQLRAKVEKLSSENQRLSQNLNQQNLNQQNLESQNKFFEDSRPMLPLVQLPTISTTEPPNENNYGRTR